MCIIPYLHSLPKPSLYFTFSPILEQPHLSCSSHFLSLSTVPLHKVTFIKPSPLHLSPLSLPISSLLLPFLPIPVQPHLSYPLITLLIHPFLLSLSTYPVLQVTFAPCFIYLFSYFCKASSFISTHDTDSLFILIHLFIYPGNIRFLLHFSLLSFSLILVQPSLLYPFTTRLSCNPTFYPHPPSHSTM